MSFDSGLEYIYKVYSLVVNVHGYNDEGYIFEIYMELSNRSPRNLKLCDDDVGLAAYLVFSYR